MSIKQTATAAPHAPSPAAGSRAAQAGPCSRRRGWVPVRRCIITASLPLRSAFSRGLEVAFFGRDAVRKSHVGFGDETGGCSHPSLAEGDVGSQASLATGAVVMANYLPKSSPRFSAATLPCPGVPPSPRVSLQPPATSATPLAWMEGALDNNIFLMCLQQQPKSLAFPGIVFQSNAHTLTKGKSKARMLFLQTQTPTEILACWRRGHTGLVPCLCSSHVPMLCSPRLHLKQPVCLGQSSSLPAWSSTIPGALPADRLQLLAAGSCLLTQSTFLLVKDKNQIPARSHQRDPSGCLFCRTTRCVSSPGSVSIGKSNPSQSGASRSLGKGVVPDRTLPTHPCKPPLGRCPHSTTV